MRPFSDILSSYQAYALIAFVVTVFATPLAMRLAFRFRVLDVPDQVLKPHARPIPYLGGAAICLGWAVALLVSMWRGDAEPALLLPVMLGGIGLSLIGMLDDARGLPPKLRLGLGALIIAAVLVLTGAGFTLARSVATPLIRALPDAWEVAVIDACAPWIPAWLGPTLSVIVGVVIVLGAVNSTNLIDGLDGLCSGVTAIIAIGFFLLASHLAMWGECPGNPLRLSLSFALLGGALGFLPFNFNPARIFMGDAGSMLLGYNCGIMILLFAGLGEGDRGHFRWALGALMIFALPIFDTALAMFRRWRSGRSIFEGDRSHFYDQLVQRGLSVRQTVVISYAVTILYVGVGLLMTWVRLDDAGEPSVVIRTRYSLPLFVLVAAATAITAWRMGLTHPEARPGKAADSVDDADLHA